MVHDEQCFTPRSVRIVTPSLQENASHSSPSLTRRTLPDSIYFLDDSGNSDVSLFGFIRVPWIEGWREADAAWATFLKNLQVSPHFSYTHGYPLHAVDLVAGRGRLLHPEAGTAPTVLQKSAAASIVLQGLKVLSQVPRLAVGSVYRRGASREDLYADLVEMVNSRHAEAGSWCQFIVDGNGTERALRAAHRQLPADRRHVLGDPLLVPADRIPLLQAADFVAHAAYQSLVRHPRRAFMWDWYPRFFPEAGALMNLGRLH
ncbi:DUF3800 domain-containing protein [Streptomyces sp. Edi2]|uniref:DUF3800 domain-containing protein n=1 Tax=Streptomyces sp. Edi2 TaxID=3162528 RepID=UPI0033057E96